MEHFKNLVRPAAIRAVRTFLQVLIPALAVATSPDLTHVGAITDLNYIGALSLASGAALISFLQGVLGGLPEAEDTGDGTL